MEKPTLPPEKPTLPKGMRDFGPAVMAKRQFILDNIKKVFQKFGFQPLETPAMENTSTLLGKYGDEGDQLLFRILDSGDFFKRILDPISQNLLEKYLESFLSNIKMRWSFSQPNSEFKSFCYSVLSEINMVPEKDERSQELITSYLNSDFEAFSKKIIDYLKVQNDVSIRLNDKKINDEILRRVNGFLSQYPVPQASREIINNISEKGLRYDLTVPFARYVVMNRNEIAFPFKRYQVQPVWRADRPQKGRYREFYQCDADVVGTTSLVCEAEIILMIKEVMGNLSVKDFTIKVNHRSVLNGIAEVIGAVGKETDLFVAIDKLDKIGKEKVREELTAKGLTGKSLDTLFAFLKQSGSNEEKLTYLSSQFKSSNAGQKGAQDLKEVFDILKGFENSDQHVELDIALARGLSYYTGCIFEVKINNVGIGSISGGGRYDNLTASFGDKENLSGVGFSFGVDRIYDALEELNLFPKETQVSSKILICHFDEATMSYGLKALTAFRKTGIASEIYPDQSKLKKQLDYANKKLIPFTIVIGPDEMKSGALAFKNMESGEQEKLTIEQIIQKLKA